MKVSVKFVQVSIFQLLKSWLKEVALLNVALNDITREVFHRFSGWLKEVAPSNIEDKSIVPEFFKIQLLISELPPLLKEVFD
ncbi:hypothetical protein D3C85_1085750 [compost metagenome]